MTAFERRAIQLQKSAHTLDEADFRMNTTCDLCCLNPRRSHCDCGSCPIAAVNQLVAAAFESVEGGERA